MAKNRSSDEAPRGFTISKTKAGKPTLVTVTFQLNELQESHLAAVAAGNETTRAEFCKQAVAYCLQDIGMPFPDASDVDDEMRQRLQARREQRQERAERLQAGKNRD